MLLELTFERAEVLPHLLETDDQGPRLPDLSHPSATSTFLSAEVPARPGRFRPAGFRSHASGLRWPLRRLVPGAESRGRASYSSDPQRHASAQPSGAITSKSAPVPCEQDGRRADVSPAAARAGIRPATATGGPSGLATWCGVIGRRRLQLRLLPSGHADWTAADGAADGDLGRAGLILGGTTPGTSRNATGRLIKRIEQQYN